MVFSDDEDTDDEIQKWVFFFVFIFIFFKYRRPLLSSAFPNAELGRPQWTSSSPYVSLHIVRQKLFLALDSGFIARFQW